MLLTGHHQNTAGEVFLPRLPAGLSLLSRSSHEGRRFGAAAHWSRIETELALLTGGTRERTAMRLIGGAFMALVVYIAARAVYLLLTGGRPAPSPLGIGWTAISSPPSWILR